MLVSGFASCSGRGDAVSLQFDYIFVESCRMLAFHK
nr:MAG TPA: hypothetical protein [Caudoviricetes sp.]